MKQNLRMLALTLSAVLALGSAPAFAAESGKDAPLVPMVREYDGRFVDLNNAWCADAAAACFSAKLIEGRQAGRFDAASPLTQAQIVVICARLHSLLTGGDGVLPAAAEGEPWYQSAYDRLEALAQAQSEPWKANALMKRDQMEHYANADCQRSTFAALILLVLDSAEAELPVINDLNQATPDLKPAVNSILSTVGALSTGWMPMAVFVQETLSTAARPQPCWPVWWTPHSVCALR